MIKELLPEVWKNRTKILEGIKNLTFKQEHIEDLAKYRKSICSECIWFSKNQRNKSFDELPEIIKKLKSKQWFNEVMASNNEKCIHCGCGLGEHSIKLRATSSSCPIGKWLPVTSVEQQQEIEKIIDNES